MTMLRPRFELLMGNETPVSWEIAFWMNNAVDIALSPSNGTMCHSLFPFSTRMMGSSWACAPRESNSAAAPVRTLRIHFIQNRGEFSGQYSTLTTIRPVFRFG